jgi:GntR family transcriptional regulator, sialic acid-inducible nan operon repressor
MTELGVGRPAIREALFALQKMGLVALSSGERARVTEPSQAIMIESLRGVARRLIGQPNGLRYFQRARILFETGIVRHAAFHASEEDLAVVKTALDENRATLGNASRFEESDLAFHNALAGILRNPIFIGINEAMFDWLCEQRRITLKAAGQMDNAYRAHEAIYSAIETRDPDRAEREMQRHLEHGHELYWQMIGASMSRARTKRKSPATC